MENKKEEIEEIFDKLDEKNKETLVLISQAIKVAQEYKK